MPIYSPRRDLDLSPDVISREIFGVNFVTIYDEEFIDDGALLQLLGSLDAETLRYTGGSVTEGAFAEEVFLTGDWDLASYIDDRGLTRELTPLTSFMRIASEVGANVQLVMIPSHAETADEFLADWKHTYPAFGARFDELRELGAFEYQYKKRLRSG